MAELIFWLFVGHFLGDYILQTDYIAKNKCSDWYIMFIHCFLYTAVIVFILIALGLTNRIWLMGWIVFGSHVPLDIAKCQGLWPAKYALAIDQIAHLIILLIIGVYAL